MLPGAMAVALQSADLSLFYATDKSLGDLPVLAFYGPSTTVNSTLNNSRIQVHVYSLAGFRSFPRVTIAPTSALYTAVTHLPTEMQGDEVYRGLAIGLFSYFKSIPTAKASALKELAACNHGRHALKNLFDEIHAAHLAAQMVESCLASEIAESLNIPSLPQTSSWVDLDVIAPAGIIQQFLRRDKEAASDSVDESHDIDPLLSRSYMSMIETFGDPALLSGGQLKRGSSRSQDAARSKSFTKEQKISLRREMCEFVDTEAHYVERLSDLVESIAPSFADEIAPQDWRLLFPGCNRSILELHRKFRREIQLVLDSTEGDAIKDIEGLDAEALPLVNITQGRKRDFTGATLFAKALMRCFPDFKSPYQDYIRASSRFSPMIAQLSNDLSTRFPDRLREVGEQCLRSALIEPVQRLPRYGLLIDNMIERLPGLHPAITPLTKARETITDICALNNIEDEEKMSIGSVIRGEISGWPSSLNPQAHLITAVDILELVPPFSSTSQSVPRMLLVFPGRIVILRKQNGQATSARTLAARYNHSTSARNPLNDLSTTPSGDSDLRFDAALDLASLTMTHSPDGEFFHLCELPLSEASPHELLQRWTRHFFLENSYAGRAAQLAEEVAKARIQARYPPKVMENDRVLFRQVAATESHVGLIAAFSEKQWSQSPLKQTKFGKYQLWLRHDGTSRAAVLTYTDAVLFEGILTADGVCTLTSTAEDGSRDSEKCAVNGLSDRLLQKISKTTSEQHFQTQESTAKRQIAFDAGILRSLPLQLHRQDSKHKSFRPRSPVKLLSNLLSNSTSQSTEPKANRSLAMSDNGAPALGVLTFDQGTNPNEPPEQTRVALVDNNTNQKSPLALLESTLYTYVMSLRSRSGNVVGKLLQSRGSADELTVNDLYNVLLEDPERHEAAAIVSVDVLFAAFEKFLKRAWRERMGPILSPLVVKEMQSNLDAGKPAIFAQQFKLRLEEMSPQNKRAFAAILKLLADLLDASGNDGDRGVLTASFAEALILVGNPHDYVMLLDRLVDDYDSLFEDVIEPGGSSTSAASSLSRNRSFNTSSLSSNASSLRRRLGLGGTLTRENSKHESESKVASIWRTLSKNARTQIDYAPQPSLSTPSLIRSRSTDTDVRMLPTLRPISRDRPPTAGSANSDSSHSRPGSSHLKTGGLSSIGEQTPTRPNVLIKKKRRSSLSDLQSLKLVESPLPTMNSPRFPNPQGASQVGYPSPTPTKQPVRPQSSHQSPQRSGIPRFSSPASKENSPSPDRLPAKTTPTGPGSVTIMSYTPHRREGSKSHIPAPRTGLSERTWPPNAKAPPTQTAQPSPQKWRVQSPQKLRQRMHQDQKAQSEAQASLQAEMRQIGEELSATKRPGSSSHSAGGASAAKTTPDLQVLHSRLEALTTKLQTFMTDQTAQSTAFRSELDTSVAVSDRKARKLDQLYKEANAENEALYDRFNDELGKVLARIRKGEGVEELRSKLGEAQGEVGRLKSENAKLKREVVGLKSLAGVD